MPATDDRWDVVVVGLRDPSAAAAMMAVAELAHYASLPPQDVERLLEEGEVLVLENLDRAEAERAAYELAELGALVDLRLGMGDSGVFPVFKPDAERQIGVAVGGLIDDSATPPTVGAAVGLPELEPDLEAPQQPRPRQPPRPPVASKPPSAPPPEPRAEEHGLHRDDSRGAPGSGVRARTATPPPREGGAGGRARKATPPPGSGARGNAASPERGGAGSNVGSLLGDIGPAAPAAAKLPQRLQRASAAAAAVPTELEVDFAAAGMARPPPKRGLSAAPAPPEPADRSASNMPRRTRAGHMGGTGASAAGHAHRSGGTLELLRSDGIAMLLVGLGVGLALSLVLALQLQRSSVRDTLPALEEELAASLSDPADVAAGKRRDPATIQEELDGALDDMQRTFLLWWLVPGALVGLLLSRLKES